jgi:predicted nucleic acid-binding protein
VSRPALLDVNVLVALFDPDHVHHELAHDWFGDHRAQGWATCPVTQNGLVRVLSNPRYGSPASTLRAVREAVKRFLSSRTIISGPTTSRCVMTRSSTPQA